MRRLAPDNNSRFNYYSLLFIFLIVIINLLRWSEFPSFIDIYYHLSVVEGFHKAGGYLASSFWEYAPVGRPHLYPPLMHIMMLSLYELGIPLMLIAKIFEFSIFVLLLVVIWYIIKSLFNERIAFFSILASSCCYSFYLAAGNLIPVSLALIFGLLSYLYIEKKRVIAASIFLSFSFYSQASLPWFIILSFLIYAFLNRNKLKTCSIVILYSLILSSPLLIHQLLSWSYIDLSNISENFPLELNLWIYILAVIGFYFVLRLKKRYLFFVSLSLAALIFSLIYRYRYLSGQGMLGAIFLSALALDVFYRKIQSLFQDEHRRETYSLIYVIMVILIFVTSSVSVYIFKNKTGFIMCNSTYANILAKQTSITRANEISVYHPKIWLKATEIIKNNFQKGDIIYANGAYVAGVVSVYSGHSTSTAMLSEVKPYKKTNPAEVSKIIIWFKGRGEKDKRKLSSLIKRYNLEAVGQTEFVQIFKNPQAKDKSTIKRALIPKWLLYIIFLCLALLAVWDVNRKGND